MKRTPPTKQPPPPQRPAGQNGHCRVLVVDDHPLAREALTQRLARESALTCCAAIGSLRETLPAVSQHWPNLVLLDLSLGDGDVIGLIRELRRLHPDVRIVALSMTSGGFSCARAVHAGAHVCISKELTSAQIMETALKVWRNEPPPASPCGRQDQTGLISQLSDRQLCILRLIGRGQSTRQIAVALGISHKTVETHRDRLREKLDLPTARALLQFAVAWANANRE